MKKVEIKLTADGIEYKGLEPKHYISSIFAMMDLLKITLDDIEDYSENVEEEEWEVSFVLSNDGTITFDRPLQKSCFKKFFYCVLSVASQEEEV
jgi:hypothetical protein